MFRKALGFESNSDDGAITNIGLSHISDIAKKDAPSGPSIVVTAKVRKATDSPDSDAKRSKKSRKAKYTFSRVQDFAAFHEKLTEAWKKAKK